MAVVRHIGPGSAFKVGLVVYAFVGLIVGICCSLMTLAYRISFVRHSNTPFGAFFGVAAVIFVPILYGIIGGIFTAIGALIYNLAAHWVGGLEVEIN
jgi:hypothetical protein